MNSTKKSIIKKSIKLFNQQGFHNLTTKEIIEHCKVSNGSFFYYFPQKEKLAKEILNFIIEDFNDSLNKLIKKSSPDEFENRLHFIFTHIVSWGVNKPEFFLFLIQMKNQISEMSHEINVLHDTLFHYIADIEFQGKLKDINPSLLSSIGISIIAHTVFYISDHKDEYLDIEMDIDRFYKIFIDSISI
tara:strand:- start:917 stop:1480 length:564 start_codon:yes stop_codon:yes gene_type:complete